MYNFIIEALWTTDASKHGEHRGYVVADEPMDAYYKIEDYFALKLDVEKESLVTKILKGNELLIYCGMEASEELKKQFN